MGKEKKEAPAPKPEVKPEAIKLTEKEDVAVPLIKTDWKYYTLLALMVAILAGWYYRDTLSDWRESFRKVGSHSISEVGGQPDEGSFNTPQVIKIRVSENQWSDWVRLPVNCNFQVDRPGWIEYKFINGQRRRCQDGTTRWLGTIPENTFQLRGEAGEVVITYSQH